MTACCYRRSPMAARARSCPWRRPAAGNGTRSRPPTPSTDRCVRAGCGRATVGRRWWSWPRPPGCRVWTPEERDPTGASTYGTGEVLRAVIESGVEQVTIGIGGSATTDGGYGILEALGVRSDPERDGFLHLDQLDYLANVDVRVACDVTNPLLGSGGAAATYGPQKGASPGQVEELDAHLARYADQLAAAVERDERETPGAGAAGGVGFALLSIQDRFRSFALRPGVDLVMELTDFEEKLGQADIVITGEGRIDAQTAFGKTALGVAQRASAAGRGLRRGRRRGRTGRDRGAGGWARWRCRSSSGRSRSRRR